MIRQEIQLLTAVGGIYFCYFQVGLIQENLFKTNFGTDDSPSPKFEFSSVLIFLQMLFYNLLCVAMIFKNKIKFVCTIKEGAQIGLLNFSSMIGSLTALQYVSFPLQALVKSCKILSVLVVGLVLGNQKFTKQQILCGLIITVGIYAFNISEDKASSKTSSMLGIVLLMTSLFSDGGLATLQSKFKVKKLEQWEMGFHISLWSFIGSIFYTIIQGKFIQFLTYIQTYNQVIPQILFLTTYSVLGQVFIYYCISCFSPRVLSVVTTTRKFFTVLLSIVINNHEVDQIQWTGISLVAFGVTWELFMGMSSRVPLEKKKDAYIKIPYEDDKQEEQLNNQQTNGNQLQNHHNSKHNLPHH